MQTTGWQPTPQILTSVVSHTWTLIFKGTNLEVWLRYSFPFDFPSHKNLGHSNLILTFPVHSTSPYSISARDECQGQSQITDSISKPDRLPVNDRDSPKRLKSTPISQNRLTKFPDYLLSSRKNKRIRNRMSYSAAQRLPIYKFDTSLALLGGECL